MKTLRLLIKEAVILPPNLEQQSCLAPGGHQVGARWALDLGASLGLAGGGFEGAGFGVLAAELAFGLDCGGVFLEVAEGDFGLYGAISE